MNIFNLSKLQIIIIWVGGFLITGMAVDAEPFGGIKSFLAIMIDTAIVVYTLGWRRYRAPK